jgi:2-polyprenyl-3-methyl-5-hydroxy-6-metoxy-1,4-benzoquinol methylase
MDDLNCQGWVVEQTLRELDFINRWLGGNAVTLNGLEKCLALSQKDQVISIADLGCGSGEMLRLIATRANKQKRKLLLNGFDANSTITHYAKEHTTSSSTMNNDVKINFESLNIFSSEFKTRGFDIILCTLFLHHFTEEELIETFRSLKQQAQLGIVVNDIHRHPLAYYSIKWLTRLFSKSAMVKFDAPLSVLRAFTRTELEQILLKAGIQQYQLKWKWAFRWQLIIFNS